MAGPRASALALAALALVLLAAPRRAAAGVIAVGRLQTCVNSGGDAALSCARKIVVTLSLENDKLYQTEQLDFELACVTTDGSPPPACPCPCSYLSDPACACRDLRRAVRVAVTKSPVFAAYPLAQPRTLNGRAHEEYITTGPGGSVGGACRDGDYDAAPTCGWAKAPAAAGGGDVPDSQGLCCSCPAAGGGAIARGSRACAWSPSWLVGGAPGSAHCMRYDENWWYRGYSVGAPQLEFDVQVHVSADGAAPTPGEEAPPPKVLTVSPSRTTALSADRGIAARLLGDLAAYASAPAIEGHWLLVPLPPGLPPNEAHSSNLDMWMVLPPALVATAGECDRVGVGYSAFRHQSNACARPVGSCLGRQVFDLEHEDAARAAAGLEPLYNITRYGGGRRNARQVAAAAAGGGLSLRLPVPGVRTSLVTLEVRADDVALVVNRAPAKILAAEVCTFDFASCGAFQAIATRGFLRVRVGNVGAVAADFRAGVIGCSAGVLPVAEEFGAIAAGGEREFRFALAMESDVGGNRTCTVVVSDAVGDLADSAPVGFHAAATEYVPPPEQSDLGDMVRPARDRHLHCQPTLAEMCLPIRPPNLPPAQPSNPGGPPMSRSCARLCPNLYNFKCLLTRGCWQRMLLAIATLALLAGAVGVLWLALRHGWVARAVACLRCLLPSPPPEPPEPRAKKRPPPGASEDGAGADAVTAQVLKKSRPSPPLREPARPDPLIGAHRAGGALAPLGAAAASVQIEMRPLPARQNPKTRPPRFYAPHELARARPVPRAFAAAPGFSAVYSNPAWDDGGGGGGGGSAAAAGAEPGDEGEGPLARTVSPKRPRRPSAGALV
jgi:hypothetical protein